MNGVSEFPQNAPVELGRSWHLRRLHSPVGRYAIACALLCGLIIAIVCLCRHLILIHTHPPTVNQTYALGFLSVCFRFGVAPFLAFRIVKTAFAKGSHDVREVFWPGVAAAAAVLGVYEFAIRQLPRTDGFDGNVRAFLLAFILIGGGLFFIEAVFRYLEQKLHAVAVFPITPAVFYVALTLGGVLGFSIPGGQLTDWRSFRPARVQTRPLAQLPAPVQTAAAEMGIVSTAAPAAPPESAPSVIPTHLDDGAPPLDWYEEGELIQTILDGKLGIIQEDQGERVLVRWADSTTVKDKTEIAKYGRRSPCKDGLCIGDRVIVGPPPGPYDGLSTKTGVAEGVEGARIQVRFAFQNMAGEFVRWFDQSELSRLPGPLATGN